MPPSGGRPFSHPSPLHTEIRRMADRTTNFWQLLFLAMLLNMVSQAVHESGHWFVYQVSGHQPVWGFTALVQVWDTPPLHPGGWIPVTSPEGEHGWLRLASPLQGKMEIFLGNMAGPLASLLGAVLGLILSARINQFRLKQMLLMLALVIGFGMSLYYLRSPLRTGGDEVDAALQLGISRSWIEAPLAAAFLVCLILGLRSLETGRARWVWLAAILLGSLPTGLLLMQADTLLRAQVNLGNPLFQPVLGVSLPVLGTYGLVVLLLGVWWQVASRRQRPA